MNTPTAQRLRAAVYARVSTLDQTAENQLAELRRYIDLRGWTCFEYVDEGVSGAAEQRSAGRRSTPWSAMPVDAGSMCWFAGASTG